MFQIKEQEQNPEKFPNEMEITNSHYKEFKEMTIKMLNKLESTIEKLRKKGVRKYNKKPMIKNTITEIENQLDRINSSLIQMNRVVIWRQNSKNWPVRIVKRKKGFSKTRIL